MLSTHSCAPYPFAYLPYKNIYSKSKDYIIMIRKSCLNEAYSVLEDNLGNLLQKLEKEMKNEEK